MYNIIPKLFGRENITFSLRDTDSIIYKIKNYSHENYLEILKDNPQYFSKSLGLMENEIKENINNIIYLMVKCYSIETVNDKIKQKTKGISINYRKKNHTHEYFKKVLCNENKNKKSRILSYIFKKW